MYAKSVLCSINEHVAHNFDQKWNLSTLNDSTYPQFRIAYIVEGVTQFHVVP